MAKVRASDRIRLSNGQAITLGEAIDSGKVFLKEIDNFPHKHPKYIASDGESVWEINQKLYESRPQRPGLERHLTSRPRLSLARKDLLDAIDHAQQSEDDELLIGDFELSEPEMLPIAELGQYDDLSSWVELDEGELLEDTSALNSFRGSSWKQLAQGWLTPQDVPPIVIMETPNQTGVADGRGRVNYIVGMGWKEVPVVFARYKGLQRNARELKTRAVGSCPVCEGYYRLMGGGRMVHHGYKRPGDGMIHRDCYGAGYPAYELSSYGCEAYQKIMAETWRPQAVAHLRQLENGEVNQVMVQRGFGKRKELVTLYASSTDPKDVRDFEEAIRAHITKTRREIATYDLEIKRMEQRIADWTKKPVKTFEEYEAEKRTTPERLQRQAEREARQAAKAEKARIQAEKHQRQVDEQSALVARYREIFESCTYPEEAKEYWRQMNRAMDKKSYLFFNPRNLRLDDRLIELGLAHRDQHGVYYAYPDGTLRGFEPNSPRYYVWVVDEEGDPIEGPYGPHELEPAKTYARIAATEGKHDRAVSRGRDPNVSSFEIVRQYAAGTGERVI